VDCEFEAIGEERLYHEVREGSEFVPVGGHVGREGCGDVPEVGVEPGGASGQSPVRNTIDAEDQTAKRHAGTGEVCRVKAGSGLVAGMDWFDRGYFECPGWLGGEQQQCGGEGGSHFFGVTNGEGGTLRVLSEGRAISTIRTPSGSLKARIVP
jgi:hypothetical protein